MEISKHLASILSDLKKIKKKGSFIRNLFFSFSSNSIIHLFNLAFFPIITRIYSPEAYSDYAIWMLLFNNVLAVSMLGYSEALIVSRTEEERHSLSRGIFQVIIISLLLTSFVFLMIDDFFWSQVNSESFWWILLVFPTVAIAGLQNILGMIAVKEGFLERSAKVNLMVRISAKLVVIIVGWLGLKSGLGLMVGDMIFYSFSLFIILPWNDTIQIIKKIFVKDFKISFGELKKFIDYPKYVFPTLWIAMITPQLPMWYIGINFSPSNLGVYALCAGVLAAPVSLVTRSMRPVFFHKNISLKELTSEQQKERISKLIFTLIGILFCFYLGGYWSIEYFFPILFSAKWQDGQDIMQFILIGSGGVLLMSPMSSVFKVNENVKKDLVIRIGILAILFYYLFHVGGSIDFSRFLISYNVIFLFCAIAMLLFQLVEFSYTILEIFKFALGIVATLLLSYCLTFGLN